MPFVRTKRIKGILYYYLVEGYRTPEVHQRVLGHNSNLKGMSSMKVLSFPAKPAIEVGDEVIARVIGHDMEYLALLELADRAGVTTSEMLQHLVRQTYNIQFDASASHLRACIAESKRDAATWGTMV